MAPLVEHGKTLYPVVVQHARSLQILMSAYADGDALALTRTTGRAHFYSRSRQALWDKGLTSGNVLQVTEIIPDCDSDSFIYLVEGDNPACHRGTVSCFDNTPFAGPNPLARLQEYIAQRRDASPDTSYTAQLLQAPLEKLLKKVGEEAIEVIVAAAADTQTPGADLLWESCDLLYHLSVLLARSGISLIDVDQELKRRHGSPELAAPAP